jgi:hypothetical protein
MNTHLIVFGTDDYKNSISSLIKSSENYFDITHVFNLNDIDENFKNKNKNILEQGRGAGYWLWKPYFIHKVLLDSNDGDVIFYVDAGNIFINDPSLLYEKLSENNDIILFDNRDGMADGEPPPNKDWTKKDTFILMGLDDSKYTDGPHVNASYQIYKKSPKTISFVKELLEWSQNENILTDISNITGNNYPSFKDHRHDQSVLSLMALKYNINLEIDPSEWGNKCGIRKTPQLFLHHRDRNFIL